MTQNYFEANGVKYYSGTVFIMKHANEFIEAMFVGRIVESDRYVYKFTDRYGKMRTVFTSKDDFFHTVVSIANSGNSMSGPVIKNIRDKDISGLALGWVWYIFLMGLSTIFNDRIGLWILISVVFFTCRSKKIKEEGTYIEW